MQKFLFIGLAICSVAGAFSRADAHAFLETATPAVGSSCSCVPPSVTLRFSEDVVPAGCEVKVFDSLNQEVDKRDLHPVKGSKDLLVLSLRPIKAGKYKVIWRVTAADCGHVSQGTFSFKIDEKAKAKP